MISIKIFKENKAMDISLITIYGLLGSTASIAPYFNKFRHYFSEFRKHEIVVFKCIKKAFKEVTGINISKFRLKGEIILLEEAFN